MIIHGFIIDAHFSQGTLQKSLPSAASGLNVNDQAQGPGLILSDGRKLDRPGTPKNDALRQWVKDDMPYMENKKCSKPPTRYIIYIYHQYTRDGTMQMLAAQPQLHLHPSTCESLNSAPC